MCAATLQLLANQWRLCRIQLVNWGTFDGYTDLSVRANDAEGAASVVCITGKSGTGKSTLFDAGTVLMMPYGRTLNAASNLARGGSPREVRTYLKGMVDTVADNRGRAKGKFLRDDTALIWAAIVHTWVDTTGALFSAARFFQLKPGGGEGDLDQTFVTLPGQLDPRALQPYASARFRARDVRAVYPGCTVYEGSGRFFRSIYLTLGIGEDGNGTNAMKLLYRIQSGIPMTNVDDLFKELVLDPPSTFDLAKQAIECYDQNQDVWRRIDEAKRKRAMLEHIDEHHANMLAAHEQARLVTSLDHESKQGSLQLWLERHQLELVRAEEGSQQRSLVSAQGKLVTTQQRRAQLDTELEELRASIYERGGGTLQRLQSQLEQEQTNHGVVSRRREGLYPLLRDAQRPFPSDANAWAELTSWADETLIGSEEAQDQLQSQLIDLGVRHREATQEVQRRQEELDYYRSHRTRIPQHMARARDLMAEAAGLDPTDIPFAAELMDLPREQELWRTAVNISLVHIADRILVDKSLEASFRRSVDGLANKLGRRYHYDFVDLDKEYLATPKDRHVSSKVIYRDDSPFAPYVRDLVCNHSTDHRCVDTVGDLAGQGPRITPSGQERVGNRGAIGHSRNTLIIGFANEMLIEDCEAELDNAQTIEHDLSRQLAALRRRGRMLERERLLAQSVSAMSWDELDLDAVAQRMDDLAARIERLRQDDELRALGELLERTKAEHEDALSACRDLEREISQLSALVEGLQLRADIGVAAVRALEQSGVSVTPPQAALCASAVLQSEQAMEERSKIVRRFDYVEKQARAYLGELLRAKREEEDRRKRSIESTLINYHNNFMADDLEHGTTVEEFSYYHRILEELIRERLDDPEEEWEAEMLRDVAQRLSRLQDAFVTETRALEERLHPVNEILGQFAFGERRGRLSVVSERQTMADVTQFRRELRRLTRLATTFDFADHVHIQREHKALTSFIELLRRDLATTGKSARHFLDVRHTVRITARELPAQGEQGEAVIYDSINGKSGGQYQELVAFILGAALLYCLGYNSATMPSYAPVYLDEAFIKADSEHTRRALGALSGLGFQVIIAVPDGKVEAVAPMASQIIGLSKDERTNVTHAKSLLRVSTNEDGTPQWQD